MRNSQRRFCFEQLENRYLLAAGVLDETFGNAGRVVSDIGEEVEAADLVIQSDGKIVVTGSGCCGSSNDFVVARYNVDGEPDVSFSEDGYTAIDFASGLDVAHAVALQNDGKIVVGGSADSDGRKFGLIRLNEDGSVDTTFGSSGRVVTDFDTIFDAINDIAIQPNGRIVAVGQGGSSPFNDFAVARYMPDGKLDVSFAGDGMTTLKIGTLIDSAHAVTLQADGKILLAGSTGVAPYGSLIAIARLEANGSLDSSFGNDGIVTTDIGRSSYANNVAVLPDGGILIAGNWQGSNLGDFILAKYTANGVLDPSFSGDGIVQTSFSRFSPSIDRLGGMTVQHNGKIVVAGSRQGGDFAIVRYESDGQLDLRFGSGGMVFTTFPEDAKALAVAVQSDGKIVAAGQSGQNIAIARYDSETPLGIDRWWATIGETPITVRWTVDVPTAGSYQLKVHTSNGRWALVDHAIVSIDLERIAQLDDGVAGLGDLNAGRHTLSIYSFGVPNVGVVEEMTFDLINGDDVLQTLTSLFIADYPQVDRTFDVEVDGTRFEATTVDELIDMFAPVLRFSGGETYSKPLNVDRFLEDLESRNGDVLAENGTGASDDWLDLSPYAPLFYDNGEHEAATYASALLCQPEHDDCAAGEELAINYYFFYPRSNWADHSGFNTHEGDWEGITVFLAKKDGLWEPTKVAFSQHVIVKPKRGGGDVFPWNSIQHQGSSPSIFVGMGGHASYAYSGMTDVFTCEALPITRPEVHDKSGSEVTTRGQVINLPRVKAGADWLRYSGRWGNPDLDGDEPDDPCEISGAIYGVEGDGDAGPRGPAFQSPTIGLGGADDPGLRWLDPWAWAVQLHAQTDTDGVSDEVEDGAPNDGDGNADGIPDSLQAVVTSLPTQFNDLYATLVAGAGVIQDVRVRSVPDSKPAALDVLAGLFDFKLSGLDVGATSTVTYYAPIGMPFNTFYQFGPTPENQTNHWYEFLFDGATGADIANGAVTVHYVDGLRGDHDLTANGVIVDPGAHAFDHTPWHNRNNPLDVNNDRFVAPVDALIIINELNKEGSRLLPLSNLTFDRHHIDTNGDGYVAPVDALRVINFLNNPSNGEGELLLPLALPIAQSHPKNLQSSDRVEAQHGKTVSAKHSVDNPISSTFDKPEPLLQRKSVPALTEIEPLLDMLAEDVLAAHLTSLE